MNKMMDNAFEVLNEDALEKVNGGVSTSEKTVLNASEGAQEAIIRNKPLYTPSKTGNVDHGCINKNRVFPSL